MLDIIKNISPQRKLRICKYSLIITISLFFIAILSSLSITSSNLMIINELTIHQELIIMQSQHATYINSQKCIISFDVLLIVTLPILLFSVFKFYMKGNLIIIILNSILMAARWISGVVFEAGQEELRTNYNNLWMHSNKGLNNECLQETCGQCSKLCDMWKTKIMGRSYVFLARYRLCDSVFLTVSIPLCIGVLLASYWTNRLDLKVVEFTQAQQTYQ